jgi:ribosomal protein L3 glutamine methyltransferase
MTRRGTQLPVRGTEPVTLGELAHASARRLALARLAYGHGTDNPLDEAAALLFHALDLDHEDAPEVYARIVTPAERRRVERLIGRRIRERRPAAYLMGRMWFAGLEFRVDERVLVPRSPIAELIVAGFQPWIEPQRVRRVLDIGTGSGCIAIACAYAFPRAHIDATDISAAALTVARGNIRRHRLAGRVRAFRADLFGRLGRRRYDIIVSNPPYVGAREFRTLPAEYRHEPKVALESGRDGLDAVARILSEAGRYLKPGGILVVEVGNTQAALENAYPTVPFLWLDFERGGGGVFLLTREQLVAHGAALSSHRAEPAPRTVGTRRSRKRR